jgi:hypothetical protein
MLGGVGEVGGEEWVHSDAIGSGGDQYKEITEARDWTLHEGGCASEAGVA